MKSDILRISTIGDSLTEGNAREAVIGDGNELSIPNIYQYWTYKKLKEAGIKASVKNYGIGGQIYDEIAARFESTIPADYLVIMAGTNDVWRYADLDDEIHEEIWENMEEQYDVKIPDLLKKSPGLKIVICSIPPFGDSPNLPKNAHKAINSINEKIKSYVKAHRDWNLLFCDVNRAMSISDDNRVMNPQLAIEDGVHFTSAGNKVCGESVAETIIESERSRA